VAFLLHVLSIHSCPSPVLLLRNTRSLERGHPSPALEGLGVREPERGGELCFQPKAQRSSTQLLGGEAQNVGLERSGERRRKDKHTVICLFNWLQCSEESCAFPALGWTRSRHQTRAAHCGLYREAGGCMPRSDLGKGMGSGGWVGGSNAWSQAFVVLASQKFKIAIQ
jgi:hypothetical protein